MREAAREFVAVTVPVLGELVAIGLFIASAGIWCGIWSGSI
ncbi:MAG: hypothetical protein JWL86_2794 [Rhizobium sp.]|nr:hypothetical protein [Rhizobium sp.]